MRRLIRWARALRARRLDLEDGLREVVQNCQCSPNQRAECPACGPMAA